MGLVEMQADGSSVERSWSTGDVLRTRPAPDPAKVREAKRKTEQALARAEHLARVAANPPNLYVTVSTPAENIVTKSIIDKLLTTDALMKLPAPRWLIEGLVPEGCLGLLFGPSGCGKTFVAVDMACCVDTGLDYHGRAVQRGSVLFIAGEGAFGLAQRVEAWQNQHPAAPDLHINWLPAAVNLYDSASAEAFIQAAAELQPSLIFVDTLARNTPGADENSAKDVGLIVQHLDRLRSATNATILPLHHTGKDEGRGARGSSALRAALDVELEVIGGDMVTLRTTKQKDAEEGAPLVFAKTPMMRSLVLELAGAAEAGTVGAKAKQVFEVLEKIHMPGGVASGAWKTSCEGVCAERSYYMHVKTLVELGYVTNVGTEKMPRYSPVVR